MSNISALIHFQLSAVKVFVNHYRNITIYIIYINFVLNIYI
jgi:hypothetical protein